MKKLLFVFLCFIFMDCSRLPSTSRDLPPVYYRFKGGPSGFKDFFSRSIKFPDTCCVIGNLITRISINPEGEINKIDIINPVDSITEAEMIRVINLSRKLWKECDTISYDQVFYIQTVISGTTIVPNYYTPLDERFRYIFVDPLVIVRYNKEQQRKIVPDKLIFDQIGSLLDSLKYEEVLPLTDELIRRDPFNRDLYKFRITANFNLDRKEQVISDDNKMMDFAEGYSLDDILRDKYRSEL